MLTVSRLEPKCLIRQGLQEVVIGWQMTAVCGARGLASLANTCQAKQALLAASSFAGWTWPELLTAQRRGGWGVRTSCVHLPFSSLYLKSFPQSGLLLFWDPKFFQCFFILTLTQVLFFPCHLNRLLRSVLELTSKLASKYFILIPSPHPLGFLSFPLFLYNFPLPIFSPFSSACLPPRLLPLSLTVFI